MSSSVPLRLPIAIRDNPSADRPSLGGTETFDVKPKKRDTELDDEDDIGMDDGLLPDNNKTPPEFMPKPPDGNGRGNLPDVNIYQQKKTLAQGMMDLALLSANANQLRYVLETGRRHSYYMTSLVLISFSLALQVVVGVGLIWNSRYNVNKDRHMKMADKVNNLTVIGVFIITVLNVFISAFGIPGVQEMAPIVSGQTGMVRSGDR